MNNIEIYKNREKYCSFPSIVKVSQEHLIIVFRVAGLKSVEAARNQEVTHHDSDSSIALMESFDSGRSWDSSSFKIIYSPPTHVGVNDPGLTILKNGDLILRIALINVAKSNEREILGSDILSHRVEHGLISSLKGNLLMKSNNLGKTWNQIGMVENLDTEPFCSREPIIELEDGSFVLSVYNGAPKKADTSFILRSFDFGKTWGDKTVIAQDPEFDKGQHYGINYNETAVLNVGKGELLAMVRADSSFTTDSGEIIKVGGVGELIFTKSTDAGLSWYPLRASGVWGQPAHLIKISNGRILCTYGYRKSPLGVRGVVSSDLGETWSEPIIINENAPNWDLGYPSSVELDDGTIFTSYYLNDAKNCRYIQGTHWSLI